MWMLYEEQMAVTGMLEASNPGSQVDFLHLRSPQNNKV
jgi:hypothetical protein